MPLIRKRRILAAETEATPGTAETLVAADAAIVVYNPIIQPNIDMERREGFNVGGEDLSGVSGQRAGTCTFQTDFWWDGTATEPFWATELLPACGWVLSTNTFSPYLEPPGSNVKTLTLAVDQIENGTCLRKSIYGAVGNFRMVFPAGRRAYIEWTFQGVWATPTDTGAVLSPTYPTDAPLKFSTGTVAFNSNNLCVEQAEINSGNTLTAKQCQDNAAGIDYFLITDRQTTITANPEGDLVANADHYGDFISHTEALLNIEIQGPAPVASTSTIDFNINKAQVQSISEADREGIVIDQITWQANKNGANDNQSMQIVFTPSA